MVRLFCFIHKGIAKLLYNTQGCTVKSLLSFCITLKRVLESDLAQLCKSLVVIWLASCTSWEPPVQVYPIKPITSQQCDSRLDEDRPVLLC